MERVVSHRDKDIARIDTLGCGGETKGRGKFCGQILERVNGKIDAAFEEGVLDFLGEHSLGADFRERDIGDPVARSVYDFDLNVVPLPPQEGSNVVRLPERELRAAGTDPQTQVLVPLPFL